jgi:hypothetical protein
MFICSLWILGLNGSLIPTRTGADFAKTLIWTDSFAIHRQRVRVKAFVRLPAASVGNSTPLYWGSSLVSEERTIDGRWVKGDTVDFQKDGGLGENLFTSPILGKRDEGFGNLTPRPFKFGDDELLMCPLLTIGGDEAPISVSVLKVTPRSLKRIPFDFAHGRSQWASSSYIDGGLYVNPSERTFTTWSYGWYGGSHAEPGKEWTQFIRYRFSGSQFIVDKKWRSRWPDTAEGNYRQAGGKPYADGWAVSPQL